METLVSESKRQHTIKGPKEFTDKIRDITQITTLLKAYLTKYGYKQYIRLLISSYSDIRGGWAFNASKISLSQVISVFN